LLGRQRDAVVEVFDTLQFSERPGGLSIDSPVTPTPRGPELIKEVPGLGILDIRPASARELEHVPRASGAATPHGELFRIRAERNSVMFVSESAVVRIDPL